MKLKFQKLKAESRKLKSAAGLPRRSFAEAGIALVVTLIMISVIAFMAITFLVISQRERGSVSVAANQTDARLAAETALQTATARLLAPVIAYTNPFNYDLLVSTNYINPEGFFSGNSYPTNVNYDYLNGGGLLNAAQQQQNIANLLYDPRPPVYITNRLAGGTDFRFFLDLNRNQLHDASGLLPETNNLNAPTGNTNFYVGDPEWIGILERPEWPHSASNRFIARYAYIAVPTSKTLDLNYIHNQAKNPIKANLDPFGGDFLRNQGVGSWELNLAAFLYDLNTNGWGGAYTYDPLVSGTVSGNAFISAESLYRYRLNGASGTAYNGLASVNNLFNGTPGPTLFAQDMIDEYTDGLLQTGVAVTGENDNPANPWPGADNPNHFFTTQDLFDPTKSSVDFTNRLLTVSANNSSYDRYTFSRLLSQLGTDSSAESGKLNLNYRNVTNGVVVPNLETNFYAWTPIEFFTNAANRLLLNLTNEPEFKKAFGNRTASNTPSITYIMIWPTNDYTPAVHRMLQVAANLYDATTNRYPLTTNLAAPTVFRPLFTKTGTNIVVISGYEEVTNSTALINTNTPMRDLKNAADMAATWGASDMVYGVPLVIGAKKGFPSFNALALETAVRVTRKLNLYRPTTSATPNEIRQMYLLGISNNLSVAAWNSYSNKYPLSVQLIVAADITTVLTNENGIIPTSFYSGTGLTSNRFSIGFVTNYPANSWAGFVPSKAKYSFQIPLTNSFEGLTNCSVWQSAGPLSPLGFFKPETNNFSQQGLMPPHWWMNVNTRLRFIMVDTSSSPNRILDYVNLSSDAETLDITKELAHGSACDGNPDADTSFGGVWCTNMPATYPPYAYVPTYGILNQIGISGGHPAVSDARWRSFNAVVNNKADSIGNFDLFMRGLDKTNLVMQAPFSPYRMIYQYVSWAVNDPLVHYTVQDLTDLLSGTVVTREWDDNQASPIRAFGTTVPGHYRPWGGDPYSDTETKTPTDYHLELKDPLVKNSDAWDFPTNKLPNLGWLGRVHRGTPWQTLYMKSATADTDTWKKWTGNSDDFDSVLAQPDKDWHLFDLFTTAPNANATYGQLPINQTGLAAWSAVLSGVLTLSNNMADAALSSWVTPSYASVPIDPAGVTGGTNSAVQRIVDGINLTRDSTNYNNGSFKHLGDILSVPELSANSPFLNLSSAAQTQYGVGEAAYERIPQQIMSLLRLGDQPRFVIYAYGQSLKPADRSIVQAAPYTGLCTNYQITGETAIRAVLRVEGVGVNDAKPYQPRVVIESYNNLPPD